MKKKVNLGDFSISSKNDHETTLLINEIFGNNLYQFSATCDKPLIIDCGAHIGVSVLYFKYLYPNATIIAFEPNPVNYNLLVENTTTNKLTNVRCLNIGVSNFTGSTTMYGYFGKGDESLGNSIQPFWGKRSDHTEHIVNVDRLSNFVSDQQVDYLKLDTEGSELNIIREIENKLHKFNNVFIEFHLTKAHQGDYDEIVAIMQKKGFYITILSKEALAALVGTADLWITQNNPSLIQALFSQEPSPFTN